MTTGESPVSVEDEVCSFAAERDAALIANDASLIASHMTDDWVYVDANGFSSKADVIGWIASGRLAHRSMRTVERERVARIGDTVVITARMASSGEWDGVPYTTDEWISDVYVRVDGRWRAAFTQKTDVAANRTDPADAQSSL
ncbi:nuclear transport factor 2 family protein [Glycomyces sp. TRM65418]|uniref:nuclear transport factor 2 family protein n=1 Tax=Glycomyces sp. TRM65418 TaxID=2867006 RepID=UPI001CE608AA|nr:nuclear transport factor 2 family protein [Glycomyces sp. TRM65418]MCC3765921.1 nuclear transport factor 2 family protein [Glycomyces sp. TRM65418]QZD55503.1 nuclear transport factor 2 family protein [Glycomyces sp. TRM65418]